MIRELRIRNFKSVAKLDVSLGRVNVLIGENGCGKSNVLEAVALAAAAAANKLDHEFLASRGIRMTEPALMRSAFPGATDETIALGAIGDASLDVTFRLTSTAEQGWNVKFEGAIDLPDALGPGRIESFMERAIQSEAGPIKTVMQNLEEHFAQIQDPAMKSRLVERGVRAFLMEVRKLAALRQHPLAHFLIYSPENSALRTFQVEGQILPLGIRGEGLFRQLTVLSRQKDPARWNDLRSHLKLLDWFGDLEIAPERGPFDHSLRIRDRYLGPAQNWFDQRSANEGFLYLLFYFTLFVSADTPALFAIDNIDQSLNPKTCTELVKRLATLAVTYGKQVLITTHNPAILDGLNLHDEEQRLFVLSRNRHGQTRARRVSPPEPVADEPPIKLSEAFLRGLLGGLPQNF